MCLLGCSSIRRVLCWGNANAEKCLTKHAAVLLPAAADADPKRPTFEKLLVSSGQQLPYIYLHTR
jgi:hypothetical protein